jgi:hypothetical protein
MIKISTFRAIDDLTSCALFAEGHSNVLKDYGVTKVTSSNYDWMYNPDVYVVLVQDAETNVVVGGERIHVKGANSIPLPIESAVGIVEDKIYNLISEYTEKGTTAELCGLWNARKIAGQGISVLLTKLGVALANMIDVDNLFVLCAPYTVKMCQDAGFQIETSIGNKGTFYYPKLDLIATSLIINDVKSLPFADPVFREQILGFINTPAATTVHHTPKNETIDIQYSISIPHIQ